MRKYPNPGVPVRFPLSIYSVLPKTLPKDHLENRLIEEGIDRVQQHALFQRQASALSQRIRILPKMTSTGDDVVASHVESVGGCAPCIIGFLGVMPAVDILATKSPISLHASPSSLRVQCEHWTCPHVRSDQFGLIFSCAYEPLFIQNAPVLHISCRSQHPALALFSLVHR